MGIDAYPAALYPVNTTSPILKKIIKAKKIKISLQMYALPAGS